MVTSINREILVDKRQYYADSVKVSLMSKVVALREIPSSVSALKDIIDVCNLYPEPTKGNIRQLNSGILIDIAEDFEHQRYELGIPSTLLTPVFKTLTCEYEHDPYYRSRFDWFVWCLRKYGWDSSLSIEYNLKVLEATRNLFFKYEANQERIKLFQGAFRLLLSGYKRNRMVQLGLNLFMEELEVRGWRERVISRPPRNYLWNEPLEGEL